MAKLNNRNGSASNITRVFLVDSSTGLGKTGLTSASTGLQISLIADNESTVVTYTAAGSTIESITTIGTYAAPTATKIRFKEVDATNFPGLYEIQAADTRFSVASARSIQGVVRGVSGVAPCPFEIQLDEIPADVRRLLGTAWLTPAVAGTPDVNVVGLRIVGPVAVGSTGNDTTHVHLPSLTFADDAINRYLLTIVETTTGLRYSTWINDWVASTALATVDTLPFTPANDDFVWIQAIRRDVDVVKVNGADAQGSGTPDVNLKQIDGSTSLVDVLKLFISVLNQSTGQLDAGSLADNTITAASLAADAGAELAALVETYIVNEGDATAVMQAIADKIAADWVAGDASPLAVVAAMLANATISTALGRLDAAVSTRASQTSVDNVQTEMNKVPRAAAAVTPGGPFSRTNAANAQTVSETFDGDT